MLKVFSKCEKKSTVLVKPMLQPIAVLWLCLDRRPGRRLEFIRVSMLVLLGHTTHGLWDGSDEPLSIAALQLGRTT